MSASRAGTIFSVNINGLNPFGIALLDELAKPEIESDQLVGVSVIFLEDFAYYLIPGLKQQLSASASNFQSWLRSQPFA